MRRRKERERHRKWSTPNQYLKIKDKEEHEKRIALGFKNSKEKNE